MVSYRPTVLRLVLPTILHTLRPSYGTKRLIPETLSSTLHSLPTTLVFEGRRILELIPPKPACPSRKLPSTLT